MDPTGHTAEAPPPESGLEASRVGDDLTTPIGALVTQPPLAIRPEETVAEAARAMRRARMSSALVEDEPPGILTDRDLRAKVLAEELSPSTPVREVMSRPLKTLPEQTPVFGALQWILREQFHHVPITRDGRIVGILGERDLLRRQAKSPLALLARIQQLEGGEDLEGYAADVATTAEGLLNGGLDAVQVARVIATVNDVLSRRLLGLAERELGPPPCPYAWLVLGSEGRMEQVLLSDQDNALVYATESPAAREYFPALARWMVDGLIRAGFPPCPGGYMATNWCRSLPDWRATFRRWVEVPEPQALLEAEIFFDFRAPHGELGLGVLEDIVRAAGRQERFLHHMAGVALHFRPAIGRFGRIRGAGGAVDVKTGGIAPIVILARTYALRAGVTARPTVERLAGAAKAGALGRGAADQLADTFRFLTLLRLREQLRRVRAGEAPTNSVVLEHLTSLERRRLRDALREVRRVQESAALRFRAQE